MKQVVGLLVLVMLMPASAQTVVLTDELDDVVGTAVGAGNLPATGYETQDFDLESLTITETPEFFDFMLKVQSLQKTAQTEADNAIYTVDFQHVDVSYRLNYYKQVILGDTSYGGDLQVFDSGRQQFLRMEYFDLDVSEPEGSMTMTVPRQYLLDSNGTAPTLGREFTLFKAFSRSGTIFTTGFGVTFQDQMPDSGFSDVPYAIEQGLRQTGHARLFSDNPVRASNGEEATFVFYVEAENLDGDQDRFDLTVSGVPQGWGITLPAPTIRIPGNSTQQFPILVSTPFAHQHGAFEHFVLNLESHRDSSAKGHLQIGIRYLEIPQPAGHHDTLWIHTREATSNGGITIQLPIFGNAPQTAVFMNAAEEDGRDAGIEADPTRSQCCSGALYEWDVWLEPGLQLGLDFDLNNTGELVAMFTSDVPLNGMSLRGDLYHYDGITEGFNGPEGAGGTLLGEFASTTPGTISGPTEITTVFTPKGSAGFIPYQKGSAMAMHLTLESGTDFTSLGSGTPLTPRLVGGELELPLFEYRDPVANVFNALAGIGLTHNSPAERFVNPSETVLFNLTLTNEGAVDDAFQLRVNGTNEDWARILGDSTVFVPTGGSRPIVVAVEVPKSAINGDLVDLIVTAASDAEPTIQGNIRVVAVVDELVDRPDQAYLVTDIEDNLSTDKESPGVPLAMLLAAMAVGAARRIRRP